MDCDCECGGSYTCKGTKTNICQGLECAGNRCWDCFVNGVRYQGDSSFDTIIDGVPVQCTCSCNGGHKCVGKITEEFCTGPGCAQLDENRCRRCLFEGREYPGGRQFSIVHNNVPMVCDCACNGNFTCQGERTELCIGDGCKTPPIIEPTKCLPCHTDDGRVITGNTRFTMTRDGRSVDCSCGCNGGYTCGASECRGAHCGSTGCRRCIIDDVPYTGNTRFSLTKGNVEFFCSCFCDGSYSCRTSSGFETSCVGETCAADRCRPCQLDGREYKMDTRFRLMKNRLIMNCVCECDGAFRCFSISGTCVGDQCDDFGCSSCTIDGKQYKGNQDHQVRPGLICSCGCDGHYECRSSSLNIQCVGGDCGTDRCKRCELDGEYFQGNKRFKYTRYGLLMQCVCNCDSTYICRGYQIISSGTEQVETWCGTCEIDGHCDGTHSCTGSIDACRDCVIGRNTYSSNKDFTLTRDGDSIRCRCECNGDFTCLGRQREACQGDGCATGGCRECLIFGVTYKGNSRFTTDAKGVRMLCECNCDGSYSCKGYRTVTNVFIPGETVETCKSCYVGGATKEGNTKFRIERACFSIECTCGCDGTWECPHQTPKYVCDSKPTDEQKTLQKFISISGEHVYTAAQKESDSASRVVHTGPKPSTTVFGSDVSLGGSCRDCTIGRNTYDGNTNFVLQDGCLRWTCACDCSDSWNCTSVEGSACSGPMDPFEAKQCDQCEAFGRWHQPETQFQGSDECYLYTCMCNCDGSWECPPQLTVQTCPDTSLVYSEERGNCRQCSVGTNTYNHKETFEFMNECIRYLCTCACDGSYNCPGSAAVRVCGSGSSNVQRLTQTVVNLRPVGYGTSKTGFSNTGGGYSISKSEYESGTPDNAEVIQSYDGKTITLLGSGGHGGGAGGSITRTETSSGARFTSGSGGSGFTYGTGSTGGSGGSQSVGGGGMTYASGSSGGSGGITYSSGTPGGSGMIYSSGTSGGSGGMTYSSGTSGGSGMTYSSGTSGGSRMSYGTGTSGGSGNGQSSGSSGGRRMTYVSGSSGGSGGMTYSSGTSGGSGSYSGTYSYGGNGDIASSQGGGGGSGTSSSSSHSSSSSSGSYVRETAAVSGSSGSMAYTAGDKGQGDSEECINCLVNEQSLPWGRDFSFRSGCTEYHCECFCNGTHDCPADKSINVCEGSEPETGSSGAPLACKVDNRTYRTKIFSFTRACFRFTCRCDENGSSTCDNALTKYVC